MVLLTGKSVILRSVDLSDIDTLLLWENSTVEPLYGVFEEQYSRDDVVRFIENQRLHSLAETEQLRLVICSHDGERLGAVDLCDYDGRRAFVSILIFSLDNRCKGFATEALRMFISYAESLGLRELRATIMPDNEASIRLFTSTGFRPCDGNIYSKILQ